MRRTSVVAALLTFVLVPAFAATAEQWRPLPDEPISLWLGVIPCNGKVVKRRFVRFETDGVKARIRGYGGNSQVKESTLKNGKAKFNGVHHSIDRRNGQKYTKIWRATVKIRKNGDVKISGMRGRDFCGGILKKQTHSEQ